MADKQKEKFQNPDPVYVLETLKTIDTINKFIVNNDLTKYFKQTVAGINVTKKILGDFANLNEYLDRCAIVKDSAIRLVDNLSYINNYVNNNLEDFDAAGHIAEIIDSFINVFEIDINTDKFKGLHGIGAKLSGAVMDIMSDLYYIGMITTANEQKINEGLTKLVGDNTSAYLSILNNNYDFQVADNDSILYKFFLLNEVLAHVTEVKFAKMGWFKKIIFFNFTIKDSIKRIINTIVYFYKQTDKIAAVMDEGDKAIEQVSTRATGAFIQFGSFIENLMDKSYGPKKYILAKLKIRAIIGLYKYFLKQIINLARDFQKYARVKPRKGIRIFGRNIFGREGRDVTLEIMEPIEDIMDSIFNTIQSAELASKIGFWKSIKIRIRLRQIFNAILQIPKAIINNFKAEDIENANESLESISNIVNSIIKLSGDVATLEYSKKQGNNLIKFVKLIFGEDQSLGQMLIGRAAEPGIIRRINMINKRSVISAEEKIELVKNIFDELRSIISIANKVAFSFVWFRIINLQLIPSIQEVIISISKLKIPKNAQNKAEKVKTLLNTIFSTINGIVISMAITSGFAIASIGGMIIALGMIWAYTHEFYKFYDYFKKVDPKGNKTTLVINRLSKISGVFMGFGMMMSKASAEFGGLMISVMIIMGAMMLFVQEYVFIAKQLEKKEVALEKGEKMLAIMGASMLGFGTSMKALASGATGKAMIDKSVFIAILFIGLIVGEIVGIMWLLNRVEKVTKHSAKTLLFIAGTLLMFVGAMALLSLFAVTIGFTTMLSISFIAAIIYSMVSLCRLVGSKKHRKDILIGLGVISLITATFLGIAYSLMLTYNIVNNIDWAAFGFFYANIGAMIGVIVIVTLLLSLLKGTNILYLVGAIVALVAISWSFAFMGMAMGVLYASISGISDWAAFGFFYANIGAMIGVIVIVTLLLSLLKGTNILYLVGAIVALVAISWSFAFMGMAMGVLYASISGISDWAAFGFFYANIGAMTIVAALVGTVIMLTAGLGAAALAAGVAALIGISWSFVKIGENVAKLYDVLPNMSSDDAEDKMKVLIKPLQVICDWLGDTSFLKLIGNIIKIQASMGSFVKLSKDLGIIASNIFEGIKDVNTNSGEIITNTISQLINVINILSTNKNIKFNKKFFDNLTNFIDNINTKLLQNVDKFEQLYNSLSRINEATAIVLNIPTEYHNNQKDTLIFSKIYDILSPWDISSIAKFSDKTTINDLIKKVNKINFDDLTGFYEKVKNISQILIDINNATAIVLNIPTEYHNSQKDTLIFSKIYDILSPWDISSIAKFSDKTTINDLIKKVNKINFDDLTGFYEKVKNISQILININQANESITKIVVVNTNSEVLADTISSIFKPWVNVENLSGLKNILDQINNMSFGQLILISGKLKSFKNGVIEISEITRSIINIKPIDISRNDLANKLDDLFIPVMNLYDSKFINMGNENSRKFNELQKILKERRKSINSISRNTRNILEAFGELNDSFKLLNDENKKNFVNSSIFDSIVTDLFNNTKKIAEFKTDNRKYNTNIKMFDKLIDSVSKIFRLGDTNNANYKEGIDKAIEFTNTISNTKLDNLQTATNLFGKMTEFSKTINGNFEGLADTINDKIMPLLEKLNDALKETNDGIKSGVFNKPVESAGTATTTGTAVVGTTVVGAAGNQPQQKQTPVKDYTSTIGEVKKAVDDLTKLFTEGTAKVVIPI